MRLNRELALKILGDVDKECRFFLDDEKSFSSLKGLRNAVFKMNDEVFSRYVAKGRNDFSKWVRECIGDVRLADALIGLNREDSVKKIEARITYIEKYLGGKL